MTRWDHARAALIAVHIAAVTLSAIPSPEGKLTEANFRKPDVRESLRSWLPVARAFGVAEDEKSFSTWTWNAAQDLVAVRHAVVWPFTPYYTYCGTRQWWPMFAAVEKQIARMEVQLHVGDGWETVYVDGVGPRWQAAVLDQERVRAIRNAFGEKSNHEAWLRFVDWLADRAREDRPEADQLQAQFRKIKLPTPEQADVGPKLGDVFWTETRDLRTSAGDGATSPDPKTSP